MTKGRSPSRRAWWRLSLCIAIISLALLPGGLLPRRARGVAAAFAAPKTNTVKHQTANFGSWSAPLRIGAIGIHAALMYTGSVVLWFSDQPIGSGKGSTAVVWNPATNAITPNNVSFPYDIFCSGMIELPNGRILALGGKNDSYGTGSNAGIATAIEYVPYSNTWAQAKPMTYARWYPTAVELPDGNIIVASGENSTGTRLVFQMEEYNYTTNTWSVLPYTANTSSLTNFYPHLITMTTGDIFMAGMVQNNLMFNPSTNVWSTSPANPSLWTRIYGGTVLLPGLERVLSVGGRQASSETTSSTNSISWVDFSQPTPAWVDGCGSQSINGIAGSANPAGCVPESSGGPQAMDVFRENTNLILLPDGTVMAEGGGQGQGKYSNPVYYPDDFNPVTNTWASRTTGRWASQVVQRTYHSTALLLPDGRVMSAGSDWGSQPETLEVFSPPYLSNGTRPSITSSPTTINYGQQFTISTPDASSITRVALIKVATSTHAVRFDERFVDLTFTIGSGQITATAPASGNYAPPGYYMLDILNSSGVPAVMPFILVQ